jgi:polyferredoxin
MANVDTLEFVLRITAAASLTVAVILTGHGIVRRLLRPRLAWVYTLIVLLAMAVWRWVVVWLAIGSSTDTASLAPWVQQINQTFYTLIGFTICVLVIVGRRRRSDDL